MPATAPNPARKLRREMDQTITYLSVTLLERSGGSLRIGEDFEQIQQPHQL